jgi:hypothetical protein
MGLIDDVFTRGIEETAPEKGNIRVFPGQAMTTSTETLPK